MSLKKGSRVPGQNLAAITRSLPELYAVASGSYASNANYGSGASALFGTFEEVMIEEECSHVIRRKDKELNFATKIKINTFDGVIDEPLPSEDGEIRIRSKNNGVLIPLHTVPFGNNLTPNLAQTHAPLFDVDVYIENQQSVFPFVSQGRGQVQAQLLNSGDLALVVTDYTFTNNQNPQPVTVSDIELMFGEGQGNSTFSIRGNYIHR